ncbi:bifunctional hydroxymethylpyrimidine kinase/phosphomethylpyrimidine kinase [Granulicella sp. 5B5]|uniref:bifunctional hydroxymethylpyrimidine kinase/phosphomethylpyrimidine kinase n=1 Tax=Granulicella sp. 5B5 TaxID=1617967 RepID=UPI00210764E9|nr:bifunctional hydroxymethylpyrimidine kinase/phosphomethylpyrimidine kinase [Granulicella sp. 5B5]
MTPTSSPSPAAKPFVALAIAGYDPSSGAGITADLQAFHAHGLFATTAITALTVQSTLGVAAVEPVSGDLLRRTLEHLQNDLPPDGIKIGMLGSAEIVSTVAEFLRSIAPRTTSKPPIPIVLDTVLISSSGTRLLAPQALQTLREDLLPLVGWATPNWHELALLSGQAVTSMPQGQSAATALMSTYPTLNLIVTGGDQDPPTDLLCLADGTLQTLYGEHIESRSTHGTGCAFSTAFLSNLIFKKTPLDAAKSAKHYVAEAIRRAPPIGHGKGPLNLLWPLHEIR